MRIHRRLYRKTDIHILSMLESKVADWLADHPLYLLPKIAARRSTTQTWFDRYIGSLSNPEPYKLQQEADGSYSYASPLSVYYDANAVYFIRYFNNRHTDRPNVSIWEVATADPKALLNSLAIKAL